MKTIPLTKGKVAEVDDADYEALAQYRWYAFHSRYTWYAQRNTPGTNGKQRTVRMHRQILRLDYGDALEGDHRDGNGLNNQRYNLRICTTTQNNRNRHNLPSRHKTSRFKGVCWNKRYQCWYAAIQADGRQQYLGLFLNEIDAAAAYNRAASSLFGEFANLNAVET